MDDQAQPYPVESLTEREYEVLQLLAAGHTNRRVAELLVLSIHTVKWHNRQIYGKLGVANREQAVQMARSIGLLPAKEAQPQPRRHLPTPRMPLLGREGELEELQRLLTDGDARLVTIVAPGGMGKTHLALEAARRLAGHFDDGAAFANLAPLSTSEGLVPTVAQALDLRLSGASDEPQQQLLGFLRQKSLLIVLDNFEHVLDGAPLLAEIVATAPNVRMLVTSRERLGLQAEHLFPLRGLRIADWASVEEARQEPAVQLFVAYGRRLRPDFGLQSRHLKPLRRLLELTEGMPLALIMAASWLELLNPAQIADEMGEGLSFLRAEYHDLPPRQRSMRAVFDSTWERLGEQEQTQFAALSVFRGGFTLHAAQQIAGTSRADLRRLLQRSLLARGVNGRLEIHELLRQFAAEQLSRTPSLESAVHDAHSGTFLQRLGDHESQLKGAGAEVALANIEGDFQNHQAAWSWAVERRNVATMGPAMFCLGTFYLRNSRYQEGMSAFSNAVEKTRLYVSERKEADVVDLRMLARLLVWQSQFLFELGSFTAGEACAQEAMAMLEAPALAGKDLREEKALSLLSLGKHRNFLDRSHEARKDLEASIVLFRELGEHWFTADAILMLGGLAMRRGNYEMAIQQTRRAQRHYQLLGDRHSVTDTQMWAAIFQTWWWPSPEAEQQLQKLRARFRQSGDRSAEAWVSCGLAFGCRWSGRFSRAADLDAQSARLFEDVGNKEGMAMSLDNVSIGKMHQGDYDAALSILRKLRQITPGSETSYRRAYVAFSTGNVKLAQRRLDEAEYWLNESVAISRKIEKLNDLCMTLANLSCAKMKNRSPVSAQEPLEEALSLASELRTHGSLTHVLPAAGLFFVQTGRPLRALEVWELARKYPFVARSKWFADVVGDDIEAAAAALPADVLHAARERGRGLDAWDTVARLQKEL